MILRGWQEICDVLSSTSFIPTAMPSLCKQTQTGSDDIFDNFFYNYDHDTEIASLLKKCGAELQYQIMTQDEADIWETANDPSKQKILAAMSAAEARQSARLLRGAALGCIEDRQVLEGIEAEIAALRNALKTTI